MEQLPETIQYMIHVGVCLVTVCVGFIMGFKAARPEDKLINREFDPGSTEEPEGDLWQDAMTAPEDVEERVRTL
jgi:hypothetical protein